MSKLINLAKSFTVAYSTTKFISLNGLLFYHVKDSSIRTNISRWCHNHKSYDAILTEHEHTKIYKLFENTSAQIIGDQHLIYARQKGSIVIPTWMPINRVNISLVGFTHADIDHINYIPNPIINCGGKFYVKKISGDIGISANRDADGRLVYISVSD